MRTIVEADILSDFLDNFGEGNQLADEVVETIAALIFGATPLGLFEVVALEQVGSGEGGVDNEGKSNGVSFIGNGFNVKDVEGGV